MTNAGSSAMAVNPFSTRCIRPGAAPFLFDEDADAGSLVRRLAALDWTAQIVGPHGVGKSTLLATLLPELAAGGRPAWTISLHDGQRDLPTGWRLAVRQSGAGMIVVDGFEQLGSFGRWRLKRACRREGWGLLVTAHDDAGLPTLARLTPSADLFERVVDRLQADRDDALPRNLVQARYADCGGNLREALLALYDEYERGRSRSVDRSQVSDRDGCSDRAARACAASGDGTGAPAAG